jgi:hypothetical protein
MGNAQLRKLVKTWTTAREKLAAIRRSELEALTDDGVRRHVRDLFSGPYPFDLPPRAKSGLVEQQRWFAKLHRKT